MDNTNYDSYGGRGIKVCKRWLKFENFLADMGERPAGLTLDRRNPNGNYHKRNCRWATKKIQLFNRRNTITITFKGEKLTIAEWAARIKLDGGVIRGRYHLGWSAKKILTTPFQK